MPVCLTLRLCKTEYCARICGVSLFAFGLPALQLKRSEIWENAPSDTCVQRRLISLRIRAVDVQSEQNRRCPPEGTEYLWLSIVCQVKTDQTAWMDRLICVFAGRKSPKVLFSHFVNHLSSLQWMRFLFQYYVKAVL